MQINASTQFRGLAHKVENFIDKDAGMRAGLRGTTLDVGFASDPGHGIPAHAAQSAVFVGDSAMIGNKVITPAAEQVFKRNPNSMQVRPVYNRDTGKYDMHFAMAGDAAFDPLAGQMFSPWNITYLSKVWKRPLSYTRARDMVRFERAGNNPFAELFTLFLEDYAGWGVIGQTGEFMNQLTNDVNVMNGMASFPIINMMGTYSVTVEEERRNAWGPGMGSPIARKQQYLNYVMDMMDAILIYFGNDETNTPGLLDLSPVRTWTAGKSMKEISKGAGTTRGSEAYRLLAGVLNDYLSANDNKFQKIKIAVSPEAYNYLTSMTYSDQFDATTAMQTFAKSYLAGRGPDGGTPMIEFIAEPLLKANSDFNPNDFDLMVITCPEIGGGPEDEPQGTNFYATVLDKFVFPVIPGQYNYQYKTLRRTAGVIGMMSSATQVWAGFGTQG